MVWVTIYAVECMADVFEFCFEVSLGRADEVGASCQCSERAAFPILWCEGIPVDVQVVVGWLAVDGRFEGCVGVKK